MKERISANKRATSKGPDLDYQADLVAHGSRTDEVKEHNTKTVKIREKTTTLRENKRKLSWSNYSSIHEDSEEKLNVM